MEEDLDSIEKNETWEVVIPIGLKRVYKEKRNSHGDIGRYKARLKAKGYVQKYDINDEEFFAPVTIIETIRVFLALVAYEDGKSIIWMLNQPSLMVS